MNFEEVFDKYKERKENTIVVVEDLNSPELTTLLNDSDKLYFLSTTIGIGRARRINKNDRYIGFMKEIEGKKYVFCVKLSSNNKNWANALNNIDINKKFIVNTNGELINKKQKERIFNSNETETKEEDLAYLMGTILHFLEPKGFRSWKCQDLLKKYGKEPTPIRALLLETLYPDALDYYENLFLPLQKKIKELIENKKINMNIY